MNIIQRTLLLSIFIVSCNTDEKIERQLKSENINDIISGSIKAGDSGNKKFVQMLLKNAADLRTSTSVRFYGVSVYKAKMEALRKIFKQEPPNEIVFNKIDSAIIKFYTKLSLTK